MTESEGQIKALLNSALNYDGCGRIERYEDYKKRLRQIEGTYGLTQEQYDNTIDKIINILKV